MLYFRNAHPLSLSVQNAWSNSRTPHSNFLLLCGGSEAVGIWYQLLDEEQTMRDVRVLALTLFAKRRLGHPFAYSDKAHALAQAIIGG
mmetsp:Transcript_18284/g.62099  ORF Transcript_18284/g.62099 Transcript_18284/m.62099 type:complete len:88 (-) Transcript_18284:131-394(-)